MDLNVLHNISYGLYIVSSFKDGKLNGQIANTVFQITSEPVSVAVSINKENLTHEYIEVSKKFTVSILSEDTPLNFIGKFGFRSGRSVDKFKDTKFEKLFSGCPVVLDYTIGYLDVDVIESFDCGTHTLFLGRLKDSDMLKAGRTMTYEYYQQVKRGTTPKTAPTFVREEGIMKVDTKMQKYKCTVCGYIYDPALGDSDNGVEPGTTFENLPEEWICPVCGASKDKFVKEG